MKFPRRLPFPIVLCASLLGCADHGVNDPDIDPLEPAALSALTTDGGEPRAGRALFEIKTSAPREVHQWVYERGAVVFKPSDSIDHVIVGALHPNIAIILRNAVTGVQVIANKHWTSEVSSLAAHLAELGSSEDIHATIYTYLMDRERFGLAFQRYHQNRSQSDELRYTKGLVEALGIPRANIKAYQVKFDISIGDDPEEITNLCLSVSRDGTIRRADLIRDDLINPFIGKQITLTRLLELLRNKDPKAPHHALLEGGPNSPMLRQPPTVIAAEFAKPRTFTELPTIRSKFLAIIDTVVASSARRFREHWPRDVPERWVYGGMPFYVDMATNSSPGAVVDSTAVGQTTPHHAETVSLGQ